MLVHHGSQLSDVNKLELELLKVRKRVQHVWGYQKPPFFIEWVPIDDEPANKMNYIRILEATETVRFINLKGSKKAGLGSETPCARELCAGEEGVLVIRNVVDDVIDNFSGESMGNFVGICSRHYKAICK